MRSVCDSEAIKLRYRYLIFRCIISMITFFTVFCFNVSAGLLNLSEQAGKEGLIFVSYSDILSDGSFSVAAYDKNRDNAIILQYTGEGEWRRLGQFSLDKDPSTGQPGLSIGVINPSGSVVAGTTSKNKGLFRWTERTGVENIGYPDRSDMAKWVACTDISHDGKTILVQAGICWGLWIENEGFRGYERHSCFAEALSADGFNVAGKNYKPGFHLFGKKCIAIYWSSSSGFKSLKGGGKYSIANDITSDGTTVVGSANMKFTFEMSPQAKSSTPCRWTTQNGFKILDKGKYDIGLASMVSGDGKIVMGEMRNRGDEVSIPVCWDVAGKLFYLRDLLAQAGVKEELYHQFHVKRVSANGKFIILEPHTTDGSYGVLYYVDLSGTELFQ